MSPSAAVTDPRRTVSLFFPLFCGGGGHSYTCISLADAMIGDGLDLELHVPAGDPRTRRPFTHEALGPLAWRVLHRLDRRQVVATSLQHRAYRASLDRADVAYLWAGTPESVYQDAARAGVPICVERINCHRATARAILDAAYRRAGLPALHGITDPDLAAERRKLQMARWIFAPSPLVRDSLLAAGIPGDRILATSYGWSPGRVEPVERSRSAGGPATFLFVGLACIRKGTHLLLRYWADAGLHGTLQLAGGIAPEIESVAGPLLRRPDVRLLGYVDRVATAYARAEVFVFPTLEEGSALVVYEAMAHGLAVLTSPMGAGGIVRDGIEGIVLDPYDRDAWISQLRNLASDPELRARLGRAARERAAEYTWRDVGARRRHLLLSSMRDTGRC